MDCIIKSALICDPRSPHNGKSKDIYIKNGLIEKIGSNLSFKVKNIEAEGLAVSPGWFDFKVNFCEPGYEYKEDLNSGIKAAIAGGFSGVCHSPFLDPVVSSKSQVEYLRNKGKEKHIEIIPIGTLTEHAQGKTISEMYDMFCAGARAFSDFHRDVSSGNLLKALQYSKPFDALIISQPTDASIASKNMVHEGKSSTQVGMKGIPSLAEEIRIRRDLDLVRYSNSKIHFSGISTKAGVELIKKAKKEGLKVSCDVYIHNIYFNDDSILEFDSNKKVFPPIRSERDRKALIKGLVDGTIDVICSDHQPENIENKDVEFEYASFGISGIEMLFGLLNNLDLNIDLIIEKISINPRKIIGTPVISIRENEYANLSLFQLNKLFQLEKNQIKSKSKNSPYLGIELKGKPLGIINDNHYLSPN